MLTILKEGNTVGYSVHSANVKKWAENLGTIRVERLKANGRNKGNEEDEKRRIII